MAYFRLIILVLAFEVLITAVVGLGIYFGFSVFPYTQTSVVSAGDTAQTGGVHLTIPLYMPALSDLKIPYTLFQTGAQEWGIMTILVSAAVLVLQSFVQGMYLGGLKGCVQSQIPVPLVACGRRYFGRMLAWSIFQIVAGAVILFLTALFFPFGLILIVVLMFFSLAPYLTVLQDITISEALTKAPRLFRRYFRLLLPLALLALLGTSAISLMRALTPPLGYAVPLLLYAGLGTLLIAELMRRLHVKLREDGEETPHLPFNAVGAGRIKATIAILLIPVMVVAGVFAASGQYLSAFDFGANMRLSGISYNTNFSSVFYASKQGYTAYEWQTGDYRIDMRLPELTGGRKPAVLRGSADITWQVDEEVRTVYGSTTHTSVQPFTRKSKLMYRLVRRTAQDGSIYYSSMNGVAAILSGGGRSREPLSVYMMVSGDGSNIFVLQYPSRLGSSELFRVSDDGRYLIPGTSRVNPMDIHAYWFTEEHRRDDVFEMMASKNKLNYMMSLNRIYVGFAAAMQEGDGRMVVEILETMRRSDVNVNAPDWDEREWTDYLRSRYEGAGLRQSLEFMTKAGEYGSYEGRELMRKAARSPVSTGSRCRSQTKRCRLPMRSPKKTAGCCPLPYLTSRSIQNEIIVVKVNDERRGRIRAGSGDNSDRKHEPDPQRLHRY